MAEPAFTGEVHTIETAPHPSRMRSLGKLIPWPLAPAASPMPDTDQPKTVARAEIHTRHFIGHRRVEEERYDAEVVSQDASLHGIMQALTQLMSEMEDFLLPRADGDSVVMEIRLRV